MHAVRSDERIKSPATAARSMLQQHWNGLLPVDPVAIAAKVGIRVIAMPANWEYSGYFKKYDASVDGPVIMVSSTDSKLRRRFTIAHELGHFCLGHDNAPRDDPGQFSSGNRHPEERAANQFAAELLMPSDALRTVMEGGRFQTTEELASAFLVSPVPMGYRINNLSLPVW